MSKAKRTALVLSGAVAKGPFHAGAVSALVQQGEAIHAVVGTSAGALTAAMFGAGLVTGQPMRAAEEIARLWLDKAAWQEFAAVAGRSLLKVQGLFRSDKVKALLRGGLEVILQGAEEAREDVPVTLVATNLNGHLDQNTPTGEPRTSYEWPLRFHPEDYLDPERRDHLVLAATASATFPGLFIPEEVDGIPCVDGGAVNNAPISYAIEDATIERVIVVSPQPPRPPPPTSLGGLDLLGHLVDILINERLHRDLQLAHRINARLELLEQEMADLPEPRRRAILRALGWRRLEVIEIRPLQALPGNALTGFWDREARAIYHEAGLKRAMEVLNSPRSGPR
ncbi:MAG: patatin-like phospholipase family protein [Myxococcales bacterium]|nr:patatin-like phospholipase family protein [Polyangiaceae bacterium]MDW8247837.1 patatin-like phospholipase family protein [Myxococcales bacterium]